MQKIHKDAYGSKIYVDFGQDISANTALSMTFEPKNGSEISVTPTLEAADLFVGDQLYTANQYVSYTITDGLFDNFAPGIYRAKASATMSATLKHVTDYDQTRFYVSE